MNIHPECLPSLPLSWKSALPKCPGIYFVITEEEEIVYIGRSTNINRRWLSKNHHLYNDLLQIPGLRISWLEVNNANLLPRIEAALIQGFKPRLNIAIATPDRGNGKLRDLRERVGLRTADVASRLNIGESTVRAWEKGKSTPNFEVIKPLMNLYGVSFDDLHEAVMQSRQSLMEVKESE